MSRGKIELRETDLNKNILYLRSKKEEIQNNLYKFSYINLIISMVLGAGFGVLILSLLKPSETNSSLQNILNIIIFLCGGISLGIVFHRIFLNFRNINSEVNLSIIENDLVKLETEKLQENIEEDFITKLIKINFKYIDQYYLQTQEQADKSFKLASNASIIGLVIICTGIIMMFFDKIQPGYITTSAGVISEFIAAIFFYLYNRTVLKMSQYHKKLVITQNISLALKISEDMNPENKVKAQEMIIDRITFDINKFLSEQE